jgi:phosphohistidine phosphatase SixA
MKKIISQFLLSAFILALSSSAFAFQTIYIVRHAEKVDESRDPELSLQGQKRAVNLALLLRDAQVKRIFVTEFKRTMSTAQKMAEQNQITPQVIPGKEIDKLIADLHAESDNALVVGHSNTVPSILKALGMTDVKYIEDNEYDRLVIVHLSKTSAPVFNILRY